MSETKKHILFITPSLANTGSEILLFHFINFLANRYHISVICYNEGSLIKSIDKSVKVHILNLGEPKSVFEKILRRFKLQFVITRLFNQYKDYTWYINTIVLPIPIKYAIEHSINFILHSHELQHMYVLLSKTQLDNVLNSPMLLVANSSITKQHLIDAGSQKNIEVINPFIDIQLVQSFKRDLKEIYSSFCWVMAGSIDANKNPQLFIDIAKEAKKQNLNYKFIWLFHSISDTILYSSITQQLTSEDLPVQFIQTNTYEDYLTQFSSTNGLLLTSTFESFSLVTLEALALSMPIVVNACGGVSEMLNENIASIVPLQSHINYYLTAMKLEESRGMTTASEKNQIAQAFDKKMILEKWEKLLLSKGVY